MAFPLAFLALVVERTFGYPDSLFRLIGHPVTWIGALISLLDRNWNSDDDTDATRRTAGIMALIVIVAGCATLTLILQAIDKEVSELPTRQREAFLLRYWEELDVAETASVMGCSEGSVKTHCSRAVHSLAKSLKAKGITL